MIWAINIQSENFKTADNYEFINNVIQEITNELSKWKFDVVRCVFPLSIDGTLFLYASHFSKNITIYIDLWGEIITQNEEDGEFDMSINTFINKKPIVLAKFTTDVEVIKFQIETTIGEYFKLNKDDE